jgi:sigma-B regulation protein RsbU (phosphoserine phosphatase)
MVIGAVPGMEPEVDSVEVKPGDRLFVFSDGVFELKLAEGGMWPMSAFTEFMARPLADGEDRIESLAALGRSLTRREDFEDDFSIVEVAFE